MPITTTSRLQGLLLAARIEKPDLHELAVAFLEGSTDTDAFGHEIVQEHSDYVLLRLNRCPLVEAWKEAGLSLEERQIMCDIAYQVDFGKFETAGYKLAFNCRIADECKSCDLYRNHKIEDRSADRAGLRSLDVRLHLNRS